MDDNEKYLEAAEKMRLNFAYREGLATGYLIGLAVWMVIDILIQVFDLYL